MRKRSLKNLWIISLILVSVLLPRQTVRAQSAGILLDGQFSDWAGKPCVSDPTGDANPNQDITLFCFISDMNTEDIYFMFQRAGSSNAPTNFVIRIDVNDDGDFSDPQDRLIDIRYNVANKKSMVDVTLYNGGWGYITTIASKADWGESGEDDSQRVELYASFADLGISPGVAASVTMDIYSYAGGIIDFLDTPVQWTPANALGYLLLAVIIIGASGYMTHQMKKNKPEQSDQA